MKGMLPTLEIMRACSRMLEEFYAFSEDLTIQTQGHGDLRGDHRSQMIGYMAELVDDIIFKEYNYKTDLYKIGEGSGYFSDGGLMNIVNDYIIVRGYVSNVDTGCDVNRACWLVHDLMPEFITEMSAVKMSRTKWRVTYKMDLETVSEYMYETAGIA